MERIINLKTYDGKYGVVDVDDTNLAFIVYYTVSGDDCYLCIYNNGSSILFDAVNVIEDAVPRLVSCGPEDMRVILPCNMEWGDVNAA